jgi:hypothetical protein
MILKLALAQSCTYLSGNLIELVCILGDCDPICNFIMLHFRICSSVAQMGWSIYSFDALTFRVL